MENLHMMSVEYLFNERLLRQGKLRSVQKMAQSGYAVTERFTQLTTELHAIEEELRRRGELEAE